MNAHECMGCVCQVGEGDPLVYCGIVLEWKSHHEQKRLFYCFLQVVHIEVSSYRGNFFGFVFTGCTLNSGITPS